MITGVRNLQLNLIQQFLGRGETTDFVSRNVEITDVDNVKLFDCYFEFEGSGTENYTEVGVERYPILIVDDFPPRLIENKNFNAPRFAIQSADDSIITRIERALCYEWEVEVTIAAKKLVQYQQICDWMYRKFPGIENHNYLIFNPVNIPGQDEPVADKVSYTVEAIRSPRKDGIFEMVFTFRFEVFMDILPDTLLDLIEVIEIEINPLPQDDGQNPYPIGVSVEH